MFHSSHPSGGMFLLGIESNVLICTKKSCLPASQPLWEWSIHEEVLLGIE